MPDSSMQHTRQAVVSIEGVDYCFGEGETRHQVLFDIEFEVGAGELVVMTGPSGSGKTTLLSLIGALRSVQSGRIDVLGSRLAGLGKAELVAVRRNIGFIFQLHNLFESLTAYENVKMAIQLGDCPYGEMRSRGCTMLERLGLGHRIDYKPRALSGGQRQRVAVARALVNRPRLVLADEPTAALDKESSTIVVNLLKELAVQDGCTIIMVTHDNRILEVADRIVNITDGHITSDVVLRDALRVCEFLKMIDIFKHLTPTQLTNVAERMRIRRAQAGEVIIRQGDSGEEFFVIASGRATVTSRRAGRTAQKLASLGVGDFFGEAALISGDERNATVRAEEDMELYVLGKSDFRSALDRSASFKDQILHVYFQRQ